MEAWVGLYILRKFGQENLENLAREILLEWLDWGIDVLVHFQEDREMDKADEAGDEVRARKVFYLFTLLLF